MQTSVSEGTFLAVGVPLLCVGFGAAAPYCRAQVGLLLPCAGHAVGEIVDRRTAVEVGLDGEERLAASADSISDAFVGNIDTQDCVHPFYI